MIFDIILVSQLYSFGNRIRNTRMTAKRYTHNQESYPIESRIFEEGVELIASRVE
jgi:hypothetical protein